MRRQVFEDRCGGQGRALGPDLGEQIQVGAQPDTGWLQCAVEQLRSGQAQHGAVDRDLSSGQHVIGQPVDVRGRRAGGDLHELDAAARQFGLGLHPVAAVGEQHGGLRRHDQGAHRAREAAQPLPTLPVFGQVLRQMRIAARHQHGRQPVALQGVAQPFDAQAEDGSACVHGGVRCKARPQSRAQADFKRTRSVVSSNGAGGHGHTSLAAARQRSFQRVIAC